MGVLLWNPEELEQMYYFLNWLSRDFFMDTPIGLVIGPFLSPLGFRVAKRRTRELAKAGDAWLKGHRWGAVVLFKSLPKGPDQ